MYDLVPSRTIYLQEQKKFKELHDPPPSDLHDPPPPNLHVTSM